MRKLGIAIVALLGLILWSEGVFGQASPYNIQLFKAQTFTASGQTGAVLPLNGATTGSTVASSYSLANITVTGTSLTTATFAVQGSADNGVTYYPVLISALATPGTTATTITVTGPGIFQFNPGGLTHVRVVTSGTFTATSLSIQIGLAPNSLIGRNGTGGGSMIYPGAGVSVSTGTSWASSKAAPSGTLVGDTDTQTLTNKTIDGVSPTTMGYLAGISSDAQTQLSSKVDKAGSTMTGPLLLNADPTNNLGAATKQYVDGHSAGVSTFNGRSSAVTLQASDVNGVGAITNSTSGNAATATTASNTTNVNGCALPASAGYVGTNGSGCLITATTPSATTLQTNSVGNPTQTILNLVTANNMAASAASGGAVTIQNNAPGTALQTTVKCATGTAQCASNETASSDLNSMNAPDQYTSNRVNGIWAMNHMNLTSPQSNLTSVMHCDTTNVASNCNAIASDPMTDHDPTTGSTDYRIAPTPNNTFQLTAVGVNNTFGPATFEWLGKTGAFGWKSQNPSWNLNNNIFGGSLDVTYSHSPTGGANLMGMSIIANGIGANSDDQIHTINGQPSSRNNYVGLQLTSAIAGGQVGNALAVNCFNTGNGDCINRGEYSLCWGHNQPDNEGCRDHRSTVSTIPQRWGARLSQNAGSPIVGSNGLYLLTGSPNITGYDQRFIGNHNVIVNTNTARGYSSGYVASFQKCTPSFATGVALVCATGSGSANWLSTFSASTFDSCTLSTIVPPATQNEGGTNINTVPCVVTNSANFTTNETVALVGNEYDFCTVALIIDTTHMNLSCREGHYQTTEGATSNTAPEIIAKGGLTGYALMMTADDIPAGQFSTKIGVYPNNVTQEVRRQVARVIGLQSDGTALLYTGIWTEFPTFALNKTAPTHTPTLTVNNSGGSTVTSITLSGQSNGDYQMSANNTGLSGMLPLPTITFGGGCNATAHFSGYMYSSNNYTLPTTSTLLASYTSPTPTIVIDNQGTTCNGTPTATVQSDYSSVNTYTLQPFGITYSILQQELAGGNIWKPGQPEVRVTTLHPELFIGNNLGTGDIVENEVFNHVSNNMGYTYSTDYQQIATRNFGANDQRIFTGIGGLSTAVLDTNGFNPKAYVSVNNQTTATQGYMTAPLYKKVNGAWSIYWTVAPPYPSCFGLLTPGSAVSGGCTGSLFYVNCQSVSGVANQPDCPTGGSNHRNDYDLFALGNTAGAIDNLRYSPDLSRLTWNHDFTVSSGGTFTSAGPAVFSGTVTISNNANIPAPPPQLISNATTTTTLTSGSNQYENTAICKTSGITLTLPTSPKNRERWNIVYALTSGTCIVSSSNGIGNAPQFTNPTTVTLQPAQKLQVSYDDGVWRIEAGDGGGVTVTTGSTNQLAVYTSANGIGGTTAIPNGTTATTQTAGDNSTKVATTAYVNNATVGLLTANTGSVTFTAQSAAGTTGTVVCTSGASCNGYRGRVTVNPGGTGIGTGAMFTINFGTAYPNTQYTCIVHQNGLNDGVATNPQWAPTSTTVVTVSTSGSGTLDSFSQEFDYTCWQ